MSVTIDKEMNYLNSIPVFGQYIYNALQKLVNGVNQLGVATQTDPVGNKTPAPPAIQKLAVKTDGNGNVHAVITDHNAINKGLHYFVEYDTNPNFTQPHVEHLGVSRTMKPTPLPAKDDGGNPQKFYFRAYSQYLGGDAGPKIHYGGSTPTGVSPGGSASMTLLPSTGSGTTQSTGQEAGQGYGRVQFRASTSGAQKRAL